MALDRPLAGFAPGGAPGPVGRAICTRRCSSASPSRPPPTSFRNEVVAWGPGGHIVGVFEKVHRVPFGEYVPFRSLFAHFADLSGVPLDAMPGHGTGLMRTPAGPLGLLVSFEIFYAGRSHAVGPGRRPAPGGPHQHVLVQHLAGAAQEMAAAIVQAVETGRDLVQAAPTGFSAVVTQRGVVVQRSALGRRQVLFATVALRRGFTPYDHWGDLPVLVAAPRWPPGRRAGLRQLPLLVVAGVDVDAGDAGRHVHGVVRRVVLEGEPQVEPVGPQVVRPPPA